MATLRQRNQSLQFGSKLELFILDVTPLGGPAYYFHNGTKQGSNEYLFQGHTYIPLPLRADGIEYKSNGVAARPHFFISNIGSPVTSLMREFNDLIGARVIRKRTLVEFCDDQPGADPTQEQRPDIFFIERRVNEEELEVEFEVTSAGDIEGKSIPGRQIIASACIWIYRGADCLYAGPPVADDHGNPLVITTPWTVSTTKAYDAGADYDVGDYFYVLIGDLRQYYVVTEAAPAGTAPTNNAKFTRDACNKCLAGGCRMRFGPDSPNPETPLRTSAFPGTVRLPRQ